MVLPQGEKSGYLNVKVPAKVRGKSRRGWKAWKRKWVVVHGMTAQATKDPIVTIDMYCNESRQGQLERSTVYLEKVKVIRRTGSKTHGYAFTVESDDGEPLLHLAGKSETDSQSWIHSLRQLLWPTTFRAPVEGGIGIVYEVSIIESLTTPTFNDDTQTVGYMMLLPSVILLTSLASGSILIEWPWYMFSQVVLINTQNEDDERKIVLIQIKSDGGSDGKYFFFSENAENIYETLISKLDGSEGDRSSVQTLTRNSICQQRNSTISHRKLSLETLGSKKMKPSHVQQITTTSTSATSSDEGSITFTKSQSLLSMTNEDSHNEEPLIEVQLRHKTPPKTNLSYDNIIVQKPSSKYLGNRRKSHSDSNLLDDSERSRLTQRNQKALSGIFKRITIDIDDELDQKLKIVKEEQNDVNRPTSVHSSVSHMSRDSGVMMSAGDDLSPKQLTNGKNRSPIPSNDFLSKQYYRPFSEFVDERTVQLSANRERSSSESSTGTIYSEIDQNKGNREEIDPLYEDLDKFRKNIHKLLGIQCEKSKEEMDNSNGDHPPPLPPRQYEKGRPMTPVMPATLHRKDVFKYLGVVEETKKRYGSLSRLPSIYKRHSSSVSKRKNIPSYLGLPTDTQKMMAASQPSLLEITYDTPKPSFEHLQNKEEVASRRISRSYIRVRKPEEESPIPPPKPSKKSKKIKFPKWRRSSMIKEFKPAATAQEETYKSFDSIEPEINIDDDENNKVPERIVPPVIEEIPNEETVQYAVPRVRKSAILTAAPIDDPIYSNFESIRLSMANRPQMFINPVIESASVEEERATSNEDCLIEEDEYADMSVRNEQQRQVQSIYLTMDTNMIKAIKSKKHNKDVVKSNSSDVINDLGNKNENNDLTKSESNLAVNEERARADAVPGGILEDSEINKIEKSEVEEIGTSIPSLKTEIDREVIKKMIFESNPQGERLKQRLSSYIDEIFAESLLEYDKRISTNSTKSCDSV